MSLIWQGVAQEMLASPRLVEVSDGVFSTCQDPVEDFGQGLIRARDTATPLVEISIATDKAEADRLRQMLGLAGVVATGLTTATGEEMIDGRGRRELGYTQLGYVTHWNHADGKYGEYLKAVYNGGH